MQSNRGQDVSHVYISLKALSKNWFAPNQKLQGHTVPAMYWGTEVNVKCNFSNQSVPINMVWITQKMWTFGFWVLTIQAISPFLQDVQPCVQSARQELNIMHLITRKSQHATLVFSYASMR